MEGSSSESMTTPASGAPATGEAVPAAAGAVAAASDEVLLDIRNIKKYFPIMGGILRHQVGTVYAVDDVSLQIYRGETFGLVGESGCGKTTLGRTVLRLEKATAGQVYLDGTDVFLSLIHISEPTRLGMI